MACQKQEDGSVFTTQKTGHTLSNTHTHTHTTKKITTVVVVVVVMVEERVTISQSTTVTVNLKYAIKNCVPHKRAFGQQNVQLIVA